MNLTILVSEQFPYCVYVNVPSWSPPTPNDDTVADQIDSTFFEAVHIPMAKGQKAKETEATSDAKVQWF